MSGSFDEAWRRLERLPPACIGLSLAARRLPAPVRLCPKSSTAAMLTRGSDGPGAHRMSGHSTCTWRCFALWLPGYGDAYPCCAAGRSAGGCGTWRPAVARSLSTNNLTLLRGGEVACTWIEHRGQVLRLLCGARPVEHSRPGGFTGYSIPAPGDAAARIRQASLCGSFIGASPAAPLACTLIAEERFW